MPSFFRSAAALALAGVAVANPMDKRSSPDSCLAAVTGKAALGDDNLRKEHCSSFFKTIVTPAAVTVTTTITDAAEPSNWNPWKRDVTVCPNEVPNYASACDESGYRSACNAWGVTGETTFTIPATTTTKTVYLGGGKGGSCSTATVTKTVGAGETATETVTVGGGPGKSTVTVTATSIVTVTNGSGSSSTTTTKSATSTRPNFPEGPTCLTEEKAKEFTDAFKDLLVYTNLGNETYNSPYHADISKKYLAPDFKDYSDSINWMSHRTLGGVTFSSRDEFDLEQGSKQQPLVVFDKLTKFGCKTITWKWSAITATGGQVMGINLMVLNDDLTQITENHAEFNSAAWVDSLKVIPGLSSINCQTPNFSAGNSTAPTRRMRF